MALSTTEVRTARELEEILVRETEGGTLVLTATSRLARRALHQARLAKLSVREERWNTPRVWAMSAWARRLWDSLWLPLRPLGRTSSLRLWHEATQAEPPPEGVPPRPSLFLQLQASLDALEARSIENIGDEEEPELPSWRRRVTRDFLSRLEGSGHVTWHQLLTRVASDLQSRRLPAPGRAIVAAPEGLDEQSELLVEALATQGSVEVFEVNGASGTSPPGRLFATPEQEILALTSDLLDAWNNGLEDLAVVPVDEELLPALRSALAELEKADDPLDPEREIRFNIARGGPLREHPLTQTALLPLAVSSSTRPGPVLSSLFTSPYVGPLSTTLLRKIGDSLWSESAPYRLNPKLRELERWGLPTRAILELSSMETAPLAQWIRALKSCWKDLAFPFFRDPLRELDVLAHRHLKETLASLSREAGNVTVPAAFARGWIEAAVTGISVTRPSPETAGIQVLPPSEALGLSFQRIWLVGAHGRALPPPPRELPLLAPWERRAVSGGTSEEQWEASRRRLQALLGSAPEVRLSRAAGKGKDDPFLPCPLVDEEMHGQGVCAVDPWREPHPAWIRAPWRRQAIRGLAGPAPSSVPEHPVPEAMPRELAVSLFATFLKCPLAGFARAALELRPLETPQRGLDPMTRGLLMHAILQLLVTRLKVEELDWPDRLGPAMTALSEVAEDLLGEDGKDPFRQAELNRLLGEDRRSGLLSAWLEKERERALQGWRFEGVEMELDGLEVGGVRLSGRVDRVDSSPRDGLLVWDYKTGGVPKAKDVTERFLAPQLPAYLLALSRGFLEGIGPGSGKLGAGFINLANEKKLKLEPLRVASWDKVLESFEDACERRLSEPLLGSFPADPAPAPDRAFTERNGACYSCPYHCLCGHFDEDEP